ncbi:MAG: ribosomal protein S18-alanine N-acetyltransferase [Clostridia bacterium]|nr:ribosomal protein S18-alanine N-acetyltransferase [Clostridia bacterium]
MNSTHIDDLAEIERACFSEPWSREGIAAELSNPNAVFYVAVQDGKAVGYGGMHHIVDVCYIANIAVLPEARRCGIGKKLLTALCDYAKEAGAAEITLEVRQSNRAAIDLYVKMGFETVGKRKDFYKKPTEDANIMTKNICNI